MQAEDVFKDSSDKYKILEFCENLSDEHPYKVPGNKETYSKYNEAWQDCLDRVISFIEKL